MRSTTLKGSTICAGIRDIKHPSTFEKEDENMLKILGRIA